MKKIENLTMSFDEHSVYQSSPRMTQCLIDHDHTAQKSLLKNLPKEACTILHTFGPRGNYDLCDQFSVQ